MHHLHWKKTWIACCLLFCLLQVQGQEREENLPMHHLKPYYFGITLGLNTSRFHFNHHPRFLQYDSVMVAEPLNTTGLQMGFTATLPISKRFDLRANPALIFSTKTIRYNLKYPEPAKDERPIMSKPVESILVTMPFQIKFNSDRIHNFRVYLLGGARLDYDLASNARAKQTEDLIKISKSDFAVEAGMGFNFYFKAFILSPEIKIVNGLQNIHVRDEQLKFSNVIDRMNARMIMFSIHIEG
jgi:hypothetical protein